MSETLDPLYKEAVQAVTEIGFASVSSLQRKMRIGYTRTARLIDLMESNGFVGKPSDQTGKRNILSLPAAPRAEGGPG